MRLPVSAGSAEARMRTGFGETGVRAFFQTEKTGLFQVVHNTQDKSHGMEEFNELMTKLEKAALAGEFAKVRDILKDEGKEHALWQPVGLPSMHRSLARSTGSNWSRFARCCTDRPARKVSRGVQVGMQG